MFAVKGDRSLGRPLVGRPTINNAYRARLYMLCVDTGKDIVYSRMRIATPGVGFMHLPDWVEEAYVLQRDSEKRQRKFRPGTSSESGGRRGRARK